MPARPGIERCRCARPRVRHSLRRAGQHGGVARAGPVASRWLRTEEAAMAHALEPGRKLARHRGSFLEGPTGSTRARQQGLSGGMHEHHDEEHAARQAHGRARLSSQKEGRAFTRLARRARSKARARASSVSFGQAPAGVAAASALEPAPRRQLRARRSSPLRGPITRPYLRSGLSARRLHSTCFPVRAPAPGARTLRRQAARPGATAGSALRR